MTDFCRLEIRPSLLRRRAPAGIPGLGLCLILLQGLGLRVKGFRAGVQGSRLRGRAYGLGINAFKVCKIEGSRHFLACRL